MTLDKNTLYIVVNYFNEAEVRDFVLSQLAGQTMRNMEIVIVNNGSNDELILNEAMVDKRVNILTVGRNLGYMGAARLALEKYLQLNKSLPDFIVLSNTDITFSNPNDIERLFIEAPADADVIGPCITDSVYRSMLNPFSEERISRAKLQYLVIIFSFYPFYIAYQIASLIKKKIRKKSLMDVKPSRFVYAIHGAAMFFRKSYFDKGGSFKYDSFLFGEEIFIAEMSLKYSLKLFYNIEVNIIHHEHATTGIFKKLKFVKHMKESLKICLNRYFND